MESSRLSLTSVSSRTVIDLPASPVIKNGNPQSTSFARKTPSLKEVAQGFRAREKASRVKQLPSAVPTPFRKQFSDKSWSAFQRVLNSLNVSEASIVKGGALQLIRDFTLIDPTPETLRAALFDIGYQEGTTMSLSNIMDLLIWFIWQSIATSPSKAQFAFQAIASEGRNEVEADRLRNFIQQFGLDVEAHFPLPPSVSSSTLLTFPSTPPDEEDAQEGRQSAVPSQVLCL
jgi:hypothetical protein